MGTHCLRQKNKLNSPSFDLAKSIRKPPPNNLNTFIEYIDSSFCLQALINSLNRETFLKQLLNKFQLPDKDMSQQYQFIHLIQQVNSEKSEILLRSYKSSTDQALKVIQKVKEFLMHYLQKFLNLDVEIPLIKCILIEESILTCLDHILLVNQLNQVQFDAYNFVWSKYYFQNRKLIIDQSFPQKFSLENVENTIKIKLSPLNQKEELIKPFLEHLVLLKVRISVSLSLAKSQEISNFQSQIKSTQIQENHLDNFYYNLKQCYDLSPQPFINKNDNM